MTKTTMIFGRHIIKKNYFGQPVTTTIVPPNYIDKLSQLKQTSTFQRIWTTFNNESTTMNDEKGNVVYLKPSDEPENNNIINEKNNKKRKQSILDASNCDIIDHVDKKQKKNVGDENLFDIEHQPEVSGGFPLNVENNTDSLERDVTNTCSKIVENDIVKQDLIVDSKEENKKIDLLSQEKNEMILVSTKYASNNYYPIIDQEIQAFVHSTLTDLKQIPNMRQKEFQQLTAVLKNNKKNHGVYPGLKIAFINDIIGYGLFLDPQAKPIPAHTYLGVYIGQYKLMNNNEEHNQYIYHVCDQEFILSYKNHAQFFGSEDVKYCENNTYSLVCDGSVLLKQSVDTTVYVHHSNQKNKYPWTSYFNDGAKNYNCEVTLVKYHEKQQQQQQQKCDYLIAIYTAKKIQPGQQLLLQYYKQNSVKSEIPMTPSMFQLEVENNNDENGTKYIVTNKQQQKKGGQFMNNNNVDTVLMKQDSSVNETDTILPQSNVVDISNTEQKKEKLEEVVDVKVHVPSSFTSDELDTIFQLEKSFNDNQLRTLLGIVEHKDKRQRLFSSIKAYYG